MDYDPTATYEFTDAEGNTISSLGDNGYIWQAYTEGLPLSINENGDWFVTPYLDTSGGQIVSYIPEWFKQTPDYNSWKTIWDQLDYATPQQVVAAQDYLRGVGNQGAYKYTQREFGKNFGLTDETALDEYADKSLKIALDIAGDQDANVSLFGSDEYQHVTDILQSFKDMSKEELSSRFTKLYKIIQQGADGTWTGSQKDLADALLMVNLIDYTKDNLSNFGKDNEFVGLYDASFLQNFKRWFAVMSATFTENNVLGIPVRLLNWIVNGTPRIEERVNEVLGTDPELGANLQGTTTAEKLGVWGGTLTNLAVTYLLMKGAGNWVNGHLAGTAFGNSLANAGNTITGAVASDFFLNDLPLDIVMFINDISRYEGDVGKALWNPEETQPLTGIPWIVLDEDRWPMISGFGPQVPGGLIMNMVGDILVDFAPKILQIATNSAGSVLDGLTNGGVTRLRETATNKLFAFEDLVSGNKHFKWWTQGFINKMMGPENANLIREARKASIVSKSTDSYIEMQNALTFNNQKGMSEVGPKFKKIESDLKMNESIKDFINHANDYGGVKNTSAQIKRAVGGETVIAQKTIDDVLPIKVKQGVIDVGHLAEIKGQVEKMGGIVPDVKTKNEIAELEQRVEKLPKKIKDFADTMVEANKRVEDLRIEYGLTTQEWVDHLREDPEFAKYMTRQTVVPEGGGAGVGTDPTEAKIFGPRRGYWAENYIDPVLALNLKVEAIGKAIAWNETKKVLSAAEKVQDGKITAGGESVDLASHLSQLKDEIKYGAEYRKKIGWDDSLKTFNNDMNSISNSFRYINDLQNMPGNASVKAVYNSFVDPNIKNTIRDFSTGKITFADGVKESIGLTDSAAAQVINNTYRLEGTPSTVERAGSVSFDKAVENLRVVGEDIVGKGGDEQSILEEVLNMRRDMNKLRNSDGEIDVGIYGLTEKARERMTKALTEAANKVQGDIDAQRTALYEKFANSNKNELDWDYNKNLWVGSEYVKRNLAGDKITKEELAEEYATKHPKPEKYTQEQLFKELDEIEKGLENIYDTNVTSLTWGLDSRALVDSDASMPFSDVFGKSDDYFQQLTRGEVRRSLYEGGYENSKFKSDIDKADNAFTQRAKENFVGYRSETSGTDRVIKIGEPLDTSAWMYGAVTPGYTDTYRAGLTGGKKAGLSDGIMYRLHIKEGTPIYMPTAKGDIKLTPSNGAQYIKQKAHRYEFVLPRDIRAIPTAISKERVGLNPFKKMTVVDVEVDASTGYAPKLGSSGYDPLATVSKGGTISDNVPTENIAESTAKGYNAGITNDGVPYKYQIANGKIITMEKITDANELADAVASMGGPYRIDPSTINHLGEDFTHGILRTIKYYNEEMIPLPTGATFRVAQHPGVYGWIPTPGRAVNQGQYQFSIKDGFFVAEQYPLYLESNLYRKGGEAILSSHQARDTASGFSPRNSNVPENTAVHENMHNFMARLTILSLNDEIKSGILKIPENVSQEWINKTIYDRWVSIHEIVGFGALKSMGFKNPTDAEWMRQAKTISSYAGKGDYENKTYRYETMSEGGVDSYCNKQNASAFTLAALDQIRKQAEKFAMAAEPGIVMAKNGLTPPEGMIKDDQYNFPSDVKTKKQKAKWLDQYRKNNPYLGGTKKANGYTPMYRGQGKGTDDFYFNGKEKGAYIGDGYFLSTDRGVSTAFEEAGGGIINPYIDKSMIASAAQVKKAFEKASAIVSNPKEYAKIQEANPELADLYDHVAAGQYDAVAKMLDKPVVAYRDAAGSDEHLYYKGIDPEFDASLKKQLSSEYFYPRALYDSYEVADGKTIKDILDKNKDWNSLSFEERMRIIDEIDDKMIDDIDTVKEMAKDAAIGDKFDEDTYTKANLWDTFLMKEISSYDPNYKTSMPDALVKKNGDFLNELDIKAGDLIMNKIKEAGVKGFEMDLATMVLSKNSEDISKAIDNFIIGRVNEAAQEVAAKMPGGATEENLNKARATMWSEDLIRNDVANMVRTLTPDVDMASIQAGIANLFKTQAEGFAAYDKLPVDIKDKIYEMKQIEAELYRNNAYVREEGRKADKKLRKEGWKDATRVVHYKEAGQDVYLLVRDPVVASLYQKPNDYKNTGISTEAVTTFANAVSRSYRMGTTSMNPIALVANVLRDPMQATMQGGFNPLNMNFSPDVFYRSLVQLGLDEVTIERVIQKGMNWTQESTMTAELQRYGAAIGYKNNVEKASQAVNRVFSGNARSKTGKALGKIIEVGEAPLQAWESYFRNQVYQQSFTKAYKKTHDVNKSMARAMLDASNSTTNFSHAIGHYQNAISTVPYLSSAVNGARSFWVQFNIDPIGMMGRITSAMVGMMAVTAWNLSSDERRKAYLNLPEWYRQQYIVFIDLDNNVFATPIPGELEQYFGTSRKLIEYTNEVNKQGIPMILAQGAFGFLPLETDGYFGEDGTIKWKEGTWQMLSGIMPQAATTIYEWRNEHNLFTGQDLSDYNAVNKWLNAFGNVFGTGGKEAINSIGLMLGVPEKELVGKGYANTLARNLFGVGFNEATSQFMNLIGEPTHRAENGSGKIVQATGLFKENEDLRLDIQKISQDIAYAKDEDEKKELEAKKKKMIDDFSSRVAALTRNYMELYTMTGGLQEWQKNKIVKILTLAGGYSSDESGTYVYDEMSQGSLSERGLAMQRYVDAGLPAGPTDYTTSIEAQAALNRFYGAPKQAASDFASGVNETQLKEIRNEFYDAVEKIYDIAEANNVNPDYDLIERIQARYLQAVDTVLMPIINEYGLDVLNNSKFIDTVEKYVNGMIPSDDWKQSTKNAKKYLSTKEFPTATVNVKKWLIQRYSTGMRNRGLASDPEVITKLAEIKAAIDTGKSGVAKSKIEELINGIQRANYYISSEDFNLLTEFKNMVE